MSEQFAGIIRNKKNVWFHCIKRVESFYSPSPTLVAEVVSRLLLSYKSSYTNVGFSVIKAGDKALIKSLATLPGSLGLAIIFKQRPAAQSYKSIFFICRLRILLAFNSVLGDQKVAVHMLHYALPTRPT